MTGPGRLIFVTGGARSGKSRFAEQRALALGPAGRTYLATAQTLDEEMRARVERHRAERDAGWTVVEEPLHAARGVRGATTPLILLDCLSLWISNLLLAAYPEPEILAAVDDLLDAGQGKTLMVVSNEVGSGVVPAYALGRAYRDLLGQANQQIAARADEAYLTVAGLPLRLK